MSNTARFRSVLYPAYMYTASKHAEPKTKLPPRNDDGSFPVSDVSFMISVKHLDYLSKEIIQRLMHRIAHGDAKLCTHCGGRGWLRDSDDADAYAVDCPKCEGFCYIIEN